MNKTVPVHLPLDVSILISARNEEKNIASLLISIANQTARQNIREILIADNNSSDRTIEIIQQIAETYGLPATVFSLSSNNLGLSRRLLVESAKSEYLVFVDADCGVHSDWVQTLISHYSNHSKYSPKLAAVGGTNRLPGKNLFQKMINQNLNQGLLHGYSSQAVRPRGHRGTPKDHLATTNALFRRNAIVEVGNFSTNFERVGEDLDLGLRMNKAGHKLVLFSTPEVVNDSADDIKGWLTRMFRFGMAQGMTVGRRFSFVTIILFLITIFIFSTPWLKTQFISLIGMGVLLGVSLISRPVNFNKLTFTNLLKGFGSYFLAIITMLLTSIIYTLGFYRGLIIKITPRKKQVSSTIPSHG